MEQVAELNMLIKRFTRNVKINMDGFDVSIPLSLFNYMSLIDSSTVFGIHWIKGKMELYIRPKDGIMNSDSILHYVQEKCKQKKAIGSVIQIAIAEFRGEMTPDSNVPVKTSTPNYFSLKPNRDSPSDSGADTYSSGSGEPIFYSRIEEEYKLIAELGEGGKGSVGLYLHKLSSMEQAVKVIFDIDNKEEILKNEVKALCHVQHQNVVVFHDAWIQNIVFRPDPVISKTDVQNMLCISMEVCTSSLDKEIEKCATEQRDFSTQEMDRYFKEIGTGLAYIHSRGVCHRDLSPNNIFIDESGVAKIGDFGSAIILADGETTFLLDCPKKALYLPPESSIEGEVDNKVDCFTFGLILFQVMHPQMKQSRLIGVFDEAREGILPKRLSLTRLGKVVAGLLEKNSEKRFSIAEALRRYDMEF